VRRLAFWRVVLRGEEAAPERGLRRGAITSCRRAPLQVLFLPCIVHADYRGAVRGRLALGARPGLVARSLYMGYDSSLSASRRGVPGALKRHGPSTAERAGGHADGPACGAMYMIVRAFTRQRSCLGIQMRARGSGHG